MCFWTLLTLQLCNLLLICLKFIRQPAELFSHFIFSKMFLKKYNQLVGLLTIFGIKYNLVFDLFWLSFISMCLPCSCLLFEGVWLFSFQCILIKKLR